MEKTKGNTILAKFLGLKECVGTFTDDDTVYYFVPVHWGFWKGWAKAEGLPFHINWHALMHVWYKLEKLGYSCVMTKYTFKVTRPWSNNLDRSTQKKYRDTIIISSQSLTRTKRAAGGGYEFPFDYKLTTVWDGLVEAIDHINTKETNNYDKP